MAHRTPSTYSDILPLRNALSNPLRNHLRSLLHRLRNPLPDPPSRPSSAIKHTSDLTLQ